MLGVIVAHQHVLLRLEVATIAIRMAVIVLARVAVVVLAVILAFALALVALIAAVALAALVVAGPGGLVGQRRAGRKNSGNKQRRRASCFQSR